MRLCFSTRLWNGLDWKAFIKSARRCGMEAIEVNGLKLEKQDSAQVLREINGNSLKLACLDSKVDLSLFCSSGSGAGSSDMDVLLEDSINQASAYRIPFLRVICSKADSVSLDNAEALIRKKLGKATELGITFLVETAGAFADSKLLRDFLMRFSDDHVGALWDLNHPFRQNRESARTTIENLGAYVKHVHIKDSVLTSNGEIRYCLPGEGDLPISKMIDALASINYDSFISLEWDPSWLKGMDDLESILAFFSNYMKNFGETKTQKKNLYYDKRGNGRYPWKQDELVDLRFSDVLDKMVELFPDQLAFKYTTLSYTRTYKQFRSDVDQVARGLISLGVGPGSHVAVWATNAPQWYIAFWAVTKIGAVLVSVNTAYKVHELEYLLRQSDTHTLIMERGFKDNDYCQALNQLCPELSSSTGGQALHIKALPFLRNVVSVGFEQKGCIPWEDMVKRAPLVPEEELGRLAFSVKSGDVCNMQYTSGTTGFPKGVMLTHYNIVNNGKCIGDRMDLSTADRMMVQVPMFHCFGMVLAMTAAMTHGATLLPLPYFSPKPALACINMEHITCFHGVPTMFIAMLEHPDFAKTDFSYMRTGIMAGSPCPISIMNDVVQKMNMTEITIVYGQTEASPGCTMSCTTDSVDVRVGTVGRALPEVECKIVNPETGEDLPCNEIGEFVARGYNIMKGYYKMPEETRKAIDEDLWLHTGDLALKTEEGNYRITGRLKDMIIRGGENIYPKEIEEFLYTNPKIKDVQVIGVPDSQYGEEILAAVILKDGEEATEEEIKSFVQASMAKHKVPKYVDFVASFPMNVAGKILKYEMRKEAIVRHKLEDASKIVTA